MMALQPKATGGEHGGRGRPKIDGVSRTPSIARRPAPVEKKDPPRATLAEAGIDKNLAHRARRWQHRGTGGSHSIENGTQFRFR
jgi:hypothetical protein